MRWERDECDKKRKTTTTLLFYWYIALTNSLVTPSSTLSPLICVQLFALMTSLNKNDKGAAQLTKYQTIEDNILGKAPHHHHKDDGLCNERMPWYFIASFVITMLALTLWFTMGSHRYHSLPASLNSDAFDSFGRYIMHNYDEAKPMADFLPALGGIWGYPMWAFYVNRGLVN